MPTTPKAIKAPTARSIAAKQKAEDLRKRKLHAIGERRAAAQGMTKKEYVAAIVAGKFRGITPEDIAAEPDPQTEEPVAVAAESSEATA